MFDLKSIVVAQPILAAAIIVVLLLIVIYQSCSNGIRKFVARPAESTDESLRDEMQAMIDEIHA
jgi:hypothetical protein